jgi:hypothetical protein
MSNIEKLLADKTDVLDYDALIKRHPWIVEKNHYCVLSPDSDGLLCGLFMSHFKNWKIAGFYDGKISVIGKKYLDKQLVFLDIEIFRKYVRSMGHHMLLVNKRKIPANWSNFDNCIQPNLLRNYDGKNEFRLKYPLGTIHMLASIIAYHDRSITIPEAAIPVMFFVDGLFNVLFSYPENVLNWLEYLRIHEIWNPLKKIFENDEYTVFSIMQAMRKFFKERDRFSMNKERGDRLKLSDKNGAPFNIEQCSNGAFSINAEARDRVSGFIGLIREQTAWEYNESNWDCWADLELFKFTKGSFNADNRTITGKSFQEFLDKNPLSWAMTTSDNIEYTLEEPSKLPQIRN